jgi:hypothetical protein
MPHLVRAEKYGAHAVCTVGALWAMFIMSVARKRYPPNDGTQFDGRDVNLPRLA